MKCVQEIGSGIISRVSNEQATELVHTGKFRYVQKRSEATGWRCTICGQKFTEETFEHQDRIRTFDYKTGDPIVCGNKNVIKTKIFVKSW